MAVPSSAAPAIPERQVEARVRIERFYDEYRSDDSRSLTQEQLRQAAKRKLVAASKHVEALRRFWGIEIGALQLQKEMDRIAEHTLYPGRLKEMFRRLDNDPGLVAEVVVRPSLAQRLLMKKYAFDPVIHDAARRKAMRARSEILNGVGSSSAIVVDRPVLEYRLQTGPPDPGAEFGERDIQYVTRERLDALRAGLPAEVGVPGVIGEDRDTFLFSVSLDMEADRIRYVQYGFPKEAFEDWWGRVEGGLRQAAPQAVESSDLSLPMVQDRGSTLAGASDCVGDDVWDNGILNELTERAGHTVVWTGSEAIIYGGLHNARGEGYPLKSGIRYDPVLDSWSPITQRGAPEGRYAHTAVWTGNEMIVWGGGGRPTRPDDGGRYDPVSDSWSPISRSGAPLERTGHSAVWTGEEMIVWGGIHSDFLNDGGRYIPDEDRWLPLSTTSAPSARRDHTAVWTGHEMVVWGGVDGAAYGVPGLNTGGEYDPETDTWEATGLVDAPQGRTDHTAVWTSSRMVIWGGVSETSDEGYELRTGGRYDPVSKTWWATTWQNAPMARDNHIAVWTGSEMIVWGGEAGVVGTQSGGRYDPIFDTWAVMESAGSPPARQGQPGVWTGAVLLVWGGGNQTVGPPLNSGGMYDPGLDVWSPTSLGDNPPGRQYHRMVWTGAEALVWGGCCPVVNDGHRYDPILDTWMPMSLVNAPSPRCIQTMLWTGSELLVWGGSNDHGTIVHGDGGIYDPGMDQWSPITTDGAPAARKGNTGVWTGDELIVWGGRTGEDVLLPDGGAYNLASDSWRTLPVTGAPSARTLATAVWTGSEMIVWGGSTASGNPLRTGSRYNPVTNTWSPTTLTSAPASRYRHGAVWTGDRMLVWGGHNLVFSVNSGGLYDPVTDSWAPTTTVDAPDPRLYFAYDWTGEEFIAWGGDEWATALGTEYNTGGRYDPATDTWRSMSQDNAPWARDHMPGVWTGEQFIVWGGDNDELFTGGRYVVGTPDIDGDGVADVCDCDPDDPTAHETPGEIVNLSMSRDDTTITWYSAEGAGTGTVHDVLRGDLGELPVGAGAGESCLATGIAEARVEDPGIPPSMYGYWYLVRGTNSCGDGTYGQTSDSGERLGTACP